MGTCIDLSLLDDLNIEERGAIANIIQPAFALMSDRDPEVRTAAASMLHSVETMLLARKAFGMVLARAAAGGSEDALNALMLAAGVEP